MNYDESRKATFDMKHTYRLWGKYLWNSLDKTVFMAKPLLTEFGIQHILESCAFVLLRLKTQCLNIAMIGVA